MSNLLVVDFDFFFTNPLEAGDHSGGNAFLYDWGHAESPLFINGPLWPIRASVFQQHGVPLPRAEVPAGWWEQFDIAPGAEISVADSNAFAAGVLDTSGLPFEDVWLFDAHHDLFGVKTPEQAGKLTSYSCENWMFAHRKDGSRLHWRWPDWLSRGNHVAATLPGWIGLDAAQSPHRMPECTFDRVFVCRSGAWVPPWCDDQFERFVTDLDYDVEELEDVAPRRWGSELVESLARGRSLADEIPIDSLELT